MERILLTGVACVVEGNAAELGTFGHLEFVFSRKMPVSAPREYNRADELVIFPNTQTGCLGARQRPAVMPMLHGVFRRIIAAPIEF